jgi:hypothetical protein
MDTSSEDCRCNNGEGDSMSSQNQQCNEGQWQGHRRREDVVLKQSPLKPNHKMMTMEARQERATNVGRKHPPVETDIDMLHCLQIVIG